MRSDWLLELWIAFISVHQTTGQCFLCALIGYSKDSLCYLPPGIFLEFFARVFPHFLKEETIWGWLSTGLVNTKIIIHFSVGEERFVFASN